ncbi:hypothetical protein [Brachybacterium paraconglomeratum]|uniref:hypothetical protein n=1 Tax=Brachybacterium paraconglomeratum TaxID=173362 RepID=UPI0021A8B0B6|nr:hypothetical protein [Brachybacterium paraconglomeratum]MCT1908226.1 hypothetical protein [Brachybacterium paraconglomeratum]
MSDGSSPQPLPSLAPDGAADPAPAPWALLAPAQRDDPQTDTAHADTAQAEPAQWDTWSDPSLLPPPSAPPERARSSALPIVAIVLSSLALAVSGLVLVLVLVLGGLAYLYGGAPYVMSDPVGGYSSMYTPGRVTDASGAVVTDVGTYDRPATLGEHTLSWPTVSGGVVEVTLTEVDWDADAAVAAVAADPANPPPDPSAGYVLATVDVAYTGPGGTVPTEDLYLCLESTSWASCHMDLDVVTAAPLRDIGALTDGDRATAIVALELAEGERGSALFSVETIDGEPLYLAER